MKKLLKVVMVMVLALSLVACGGAGGKEGASTGGEPTTAGGTGEKYKIGILAPAVTHGWVAAVAYHAEARAKELGDEVDYKIYTSNNATEMTSQLDDLKTWGAQAIVAFPQWEGMEVPIKEVVDAGIKVVNFDIEIAVDGVYRVTGDNEGMGTRGAEYIVEKIGKEGTVVILDVPSSGSVAKLRKQGFEAKMKELAPDVKLVTAATQFTREAGLTDMSDILSANAKIDAVFSMDDETSIGALQAISEAGRTDVKAITGGGGSQEYFKMMPENEAIWISSALYSPDMVKDAVDAALKLLKGEEVEPVVIIPTEIVDRTNSEEHLDANSPY